MDTVQISHSRVQAYERCPWMYHLIFNEGWRSGPTAMAAFGHSLHRALDAYLAQDNNDRSLDRLHEFFDQVWVNEGFGSPQETLDTYEQGRQMLQRFYELDKNRRSEVVATEKEFETELEPGVIFKGMVDRLDRLPDGAYEIIEYKTHGETWSDDRIQADPQMTLYALGISETFPEISSGKCPLKLTYYFLSSGKSARTARTNQQLEEARQRLINIAGKIRRNEFAPNHSYCARCEFGKRCVNFKP